jgi:RimJ/RimL family protein N-acetyltransferase
MSVRLRPTTREDLPRRVAWMNDYDVTEFTGRDVGEVTLEEAEAKFAERTDPDWVLEVDGRAVGMCGLHLDQSKQNAGFGIVIGEKDCWGKGYGTAALQEVLRIAFAEIGLHRVHLHAFPGNARGMRCYEKCGFRREGLLVQAHWKRGRWLDVIPMAILKSEWEARQ